MNGSTIRNLIIGIIAIAVVAVAAGLLYLQIAGGSGEASADIDEVSETLDTAENADSNANATLFRIQSDESEASFTLDEDLSGIRTTVVGTTDQVGGDILVNFDEPSASEVGVITINARTIETDENRRNQALRARILRSAEDDYEFITFTPTAVSGVPASVAVGDTVTFQLTGDLAIIDTVNEVTFDVEATLVSEEQLDGTASATVAYADWGIGVPSVPFVANVDDDVLLTITFVATAVGDDMADEMTSEATAAADE